MYSLQDLELLNDMPFIVLVKDEELRYVWVNRAWLKVANATLEDVRGKSDEELVWSKDTAALTQNDRVVLESGEPLNVEEHVTQADGTILKAQVCKFSAEVDGQKCVIGIAIPIG